MVTTSDTSSVTEPERIDVLDDSALQRWADRLDATPEQLKSAVEAVGDLAPDVEMYLKGTHSTTNADRVEEADDASAGPT